MKKTTWLLIVALFVVVGCQAAPTPTPAPTPVPANTPTALPTSAPTATLSPTSTATAAPTMTPTLQPTATPEGPGTPPVIQSVNVRYEAAASGKIAFQEITFQDAEGDASKVHYEVVSTTAKSVNVTDGPVRTGDNQKSGASIVGTWTCGTDKYEVTLRVILIDQKDNSSKPMQYTIRCD